MTAFAFNIDPGVLITLINGMGIMALIALAIGILERGSLSHRQRTVGHGILFGLGAILAMMAPAEVMPGVMVDARSTIIGLSGAFVSPMATVIAAVLAIAYRVIGIGGIGATPGTIGIVLAAVLGMAWPVMTRRRGRDLSLVQLIQLGTFVKISIVAVFWLPWEHAMMVLPNLLLTVPAGTVAGVVLGRMIQRELRLVERERRLKHEALTDPLTGLVNRRGFDVALADQASSSPADGGALLLLDIDHFKRVNDRLGHDVGDDVLRKLSDLLAVNARNGDVVARLGGEEFGVLLRGANGSQARDAAERLRKTIATADFHSGTDMFRITASVGLSLQSDWRGEANRAYRITDEALYSAKRNGRNQVELARSDAPSVNTPDRRAALKSAPALGPALRYETSGSA